MGAVAMMTMLRNFKYLGLALSCLLLLNGTSADAATNGISATYNGAMVIGYDPNTCNSGITGALRYNSSNGAWNYCNGSAWTNVTGSGGGSGICYSTGWIKLNTGAPNGGLNYLTGATDASVLYAGSYNDNIYKSTDYGSTWTAIGANRAFTGIATSSDGSVITGVVDSGKVYVSTNTGSTFTAYDSSRRWTSVAMSSDGVKQVATVKNSGFIYTSTNTGATWTQRASAAAWSSVTSSSDGTKLAAVVNGGTAWTSTDSGVTWTQRTGTGTASWDRIVGSADGMTLYVTDGTSGAGAMRSTDGGATWTGTSYGYIGATFMTPDGTKMLASIDGAALAYSKDGGVTFYATGKVSQDDPSATFMTSDGSKMYDTVGYVGVYAAPTTCGP